MNHYDWRWKIEEAVERLRSRYDHIGRKTGAPFLALVYPPEAQAAMFTEWRTQTQALHPEIDVQPVDVLAVTQGVLSDIGAENIVDSLKDPMPGSDPMADLGHLWTTAIAETVHQGFAENPSSRPVISLERLAALWPVIGPRDVMQTLWDSQETLRGPVTALIPGRLEGPRTYTFVDKKREFMYRGDLL